MLAVEFLPVGDSNGDAILVQYGDQSGYRLFLVDGGYASIGEEIIDHIERHYGSDIEIGHMVVSHADNDHAAGLISVFKRFRVYSFWMNRPWIYGREVIENFHGNWTLQGWTKHVRDQHEYLVELENIAVSRGMEVNPAFQGAQIGPSLVLAPSLKRYLSLIPNLDKTPAPYRSEVAAKSIFETARIRQVKETLEIETLDKSPPATSASNETSVVQLIRYDNINVLLTADVGPEGLLEAASFASHNGILAAPHLVQIPHQGSRRNVTPAALDAWLGRPNGGRAIRGKAFVSVGQKKTDHPRKKVKNAFIRRGYDVYVGRNGWIRQPRISVTRKQHVA